MGVYDARTNTIVIDRSMSYRQKRCTLVHELVHWSHDDNTCIGWMGGKQERRCRRETALLLVEPLEYASAENIYDGDPYLIANELDVTLQVVEDYRIWLHDSAVV